MHHFNLVKGPWSQQRAQVFFRHSWGSHQSDHRQQIRQFIFEEICGGQNPSVLNLSSPPQLRRGYVSVSHEPSRGMVGYAPCPIGVDVESIQRINPETVVQLSNMEELSGAPRMEFNWPAKEAVFKALQFFRQPRSMDQIHLHWNQNEFFLKNGDRFGCEKGLGYLQEDDNILTAVYLTTTA